jgi:hypothetical protein
MRRRLFSILTLLLISGVNIAFAQGTEKKLVQFSGIVVTADSLRPVPYTSIMIKDARRGTISDYYGFFSFVAQEKDIIEFTAMGFKKTTFRIPDSLANSRYSLIQVMTSDTVTLPTAVIYPWPTGEQFKQAFLKLNVPEDDIDRAKKNMALAEAKDKIQGLEMDAGMNYNNYIQQQTSKLYYAGQLPPNNLLNPIAWAQFIKAWREGKFKQNKDK